SFAFIGVGPRLGYKIITALVSTSPASSILVLTRSEPEPGIFPESVTVAVVDYGNVDQVREVLKQHAIEVIISTIGFGGVATQVKVAEAAVSAGTVKLFLPSEFGIPTEGRKDPGLGLKSNIADQIKDLGVPVLRIIGFFIDDIPGLTGITETAKLHILKGTTGTGNVAGYTCSRVRSDLVSFAEVFKVPIEKDAEEIPSAFGPIAKMAQMILPQGSSGWDPKTNAEIEGAAGSDNSLWKEDGWQSVEKVHDL
ncbi:NAD(P)-binding protein, partial [Flagelloscypha sp. PMI_526]